MSWLSVFFVGWIILLALRGYVRGFWVSLFDLCGLLAAYIACIVFGQKAVSFLLDQGLPAHFAYLGGFVGLFIAVNLLVSFGAGAAFASSMRKQKLLWHGALLGAFSGVFSGLVMVWCFNLADGVLFNKLNTEDAKLADNEQGVIDKNKHAFLSSTANSLMATATNLGAKLGGANSQQADMLTAIATSPAEFTRDLQAVSQSSELKHFFSDPEVQQLMATNNHEALVSNDRFQALMQNPAAQSLRNSLAHSKGEMLQQKSHELASEDLVLDKYLASELTHLWQRLTLLKNDSEVQALLQDEEVQQLIENKNIVELLTNQKIQKLISKLMEDDTELQDVDFTQYIDTSESSAALKGLPKEA